MNTATIGYPVYDCDHHYYEPPEAFLRHLPNEFKKDFQYVEVNGRTKLVVGGVLSDYIPNPTFRGVAEVGPHEGWYRGSNAEGRSIREYGGTPVESGAQFHSGEAQRARGDRAGG